MYAWVWRRLPGPWPLRATIALAVVASITIALFTWGFPAFDDWLGVNEVTVD